LDFWGIISYFLGVSSILRKNPDNVSPFYQIGFGDQNISGLLDSLYIHPPK
jgi:hypothetical protein